MSDFRDVLETRDIYVVRWKRDKPGRYTQHLDEDEAMVNLNDTKNPIYGPARVEYVVDDRKRVTFTVHEWNGDDK